MNTADNRLTKGEHPGRLASFLQGMGVQLQTLGFESGNDCRSLHLQGAPGEHFIKTVPVCSP